MTTNLRDRAPTGRGWHHLTDDQRRARTEPARRIAAAERHRRRRERLNQIQAEWRGYDLAGKRDALRWLTRLQDHSHRVQALREAIRDAIVADLRT